jgi:hypothetical protein
MRFIQLPVPLALILLAVPMSSQAIQEPAYSVVRTVGNVEIRQYASYVVAEVVVPGPASEAGNTGFRILAAYIFGKNKGERRLAMTSPVTQRPTPLKLAMTAPVTQRAAPTGSLVQFVLPQDVTLATAPVPLDERITVRDVPASRIAVIRFSGFWTDGNYNQHLAMLKDALAAANLKWSGEPVYSRYNSPFALWFLRRNEIWLTLE